MQSESALQTRAGKQTRSQALAASQPADRQRGGGEISAAAGERAEDWAMTPELLSAMGLDSHTEGDSFPLGGPQRTAASVGSSGNRSGASVLEQLKTKAPTQVANQIEHPPFSWLASYEVVFADTEIQLKVKAKLEPQPGVSRDDILELGLRAADAFRSYYDSKFIFTDTGSGKQYLLRCMVAFVESGEHYTIKVHPGGNVGTSGHRQKWFVGWPGLVCAHELGHQLALKDEYIDARAPDRVTRESPGVHQDHSVMGNYHAEGSDQASVKLRHGETIAGHIGAASGHAFAVTKK